jgi:hypothetical protein
MNGFGRNWLLVTVSLAIAIVVAILAIALFPNNTSEIITLFFSAIVAIAAIFYTMLTSALVSEINELKSLLFSNESSYPHKNETNGLGRIRTGDLRRVKASDLAGFHRCLEVI